MTNSIQTGDWEYLGTVVMNGVEFIALQPLDGTSQACFFLCDAGEYRLVVDEDTERAVSWRFRRFAMENSQSRENEAR